MRNPGNEYRTIPSARADLFKLRDGWRVLAGVFHQLVAAGLPGGREVGRVWHGGVWSSGPCRRLAASGDRRLPRGKGSTTSARRSTPSTCAILKCRIDGTRGRTGAAYAIGYSQGRIALGKTAIAAALSAARPPIAEVFHFDSVGVPPAEERLSRWRGEGAWQRAMTFQGIARISRMKELNRPVLFGCGCHLCKKASSIIRFAGSGRDHRAVSMSASTTSTGPHRSEVGPDVLYPAPGDWSSSSSTGPLPISLPP